MAIAKWHHRNFGFVVANNNQFFVGFKFNLWTVREKPPCYVYKDGTVTNERSYIYGFFDFFTYEA